MTECVKQVQLILGEKDGNAIVRFKQSLNLKKELQRIRTGMCGIRTPIYMGAIRRHTHTNSQPVHLTEFVSIFHKNESFDTKHINRISRAPFQQIVVKELFHSY